VRRDEHLRGPPRPAYPARSVARMRGGASFESPRLPQTPAVQARPPPPVSSTLFPRLSFVRPPAASSTQPPDSFLPSQPLSRNFRVSGVSRGLAPLPSRLVAFLSRYPPVLPFQSLRRFARELTTFLDILKPFELPCAYAVPILCFSSAIIPTTLQ
jgi:hypothetical protein